MRTSRLYLTRIPCTTRRLLSKPSRNVVASASCPIWTNWIPICVSDKFLLSIIFAASTMTVSTSSATVHGKQSVSMRKY